MAICQRDFSSRKIIPHHSSLQPSCPFLSSLAFRLNICLLFILFLFISLSRCQIVTHARIQLTCKVFLSSLAHLKIFILFFIIPHDVIFLVARHPKKWTPSAANGTLFHFPFSKYTKTFFGQKNTQSQTRPPPPLMAKDLFSIFGPFPIPSKKTLSCVQFFST